MTDAKDLIERMRVLGALIRESEGVAGYHLNGEVEPWGEIEPLPDQAADRLAALQAENERLRELLTECSDDLADELEARYPEASRVYPGEARRYARDMDTVIRARAALAQEDKG